MPRSSALLQHLAALGVALLGTVGVVGLSLGMNATVQKKAEDVEGAVALVSAVPEAPRKASQRKQRSSPVKKMARAASNPAPALAAGLAGLDFGLDRGADAAMLGATGALISEVGVEVVDEDAVEVPPQATERTPPDYPSRARAQGQTGHVTVSFIVDIDGTAVEAHVVESSPPGVFDEAALAAVGAWRFDPGRNAGAPVAVRVRQTLRFELE